MSALGVLTVTGLRGRRRLGLAAAFGVLVLAALALAAGLVVSTQGAPLLDAAAERADVAHLVLKGDPDAVTSVAGDPEVVAWSGPFTTVSGVELPLDGEVVPMEITAIDDPGIEVNQPPIQDGRWAVSESELVLDYSAGQDLAIEVGDPIEFRIEGRQVGFTVVGTAVNFTDCFYPQCDPARAWVTTAGITRFDAGEDEYAQAFLRFGEAAQADPFVERQAAAGVEGIGSTESWLDTRGDFLTLDRVFGTFVAAFGVFVLVVAAVIIAGSTAMRIVSQRRQIGLLGAIGSTPRQITIALLIENLVLGTVAGVVGWFLGGLMASSLQLGIGRTLGPQDPSWGVTELVTTVLVILVLLTIATVVPAVSAARRPVTDVLRDVPPERASWFNRRAGRVPTRLSLLGAQEAAGQPVRSALAALAIAVAVIGTLVSIGFVRALDLATTEAAMAGDPWDVAVVPEGLPPDQVTAVIENTPGTTTWFGEYERRSTFRDGAFLSVAIGGDPAGAAFSIADGRPLTRQGEAIVGYGFMKRFDVAVGDRVEFLAGTTPIDVTVVGWYRDTEDSGEILRYRIEDLQAAEPGIEPSVYRVAVSDGIDPVTVGDVLGSSLGPPARVEILDTGRADMEPLFVSLRLVAVVLLATAGINLLSTLLTASRETAGRTGVQLALGFTPRQVIAQGAVSGATLGLLAAVIGVPVGMLVFRLMADAVSSGIGVGPGWMPALPWSLLLGVAVSAVVVAGALGALAVRRIAGQPASDLVRGE